MQVSDQCCKALTTLDLYEKHKTRGCDSVSNFDGRISLRFNHIHSNTEGTSSNNVDVESVRTSVISDSFVLQAALKQVSNRVDRFTFEVQPVQYLQVQQDPQPVVMINFSSNMLID